MSAEVHLKTDNIRRVALIGAGVTSLACAHYLEKILAKSGDKLEILIFEQASHIGGKIISSRRGDYLVEFGADSVATRQPAVKEILEDLNFSAETIAPKLRRFSILKNAKLQVVDLSLLAPFPQNALGLLRTNLVSFVGKIRGLLGLILSFVFGEKIFLGDKDQDLATYFRKKWGYQMSTSLLEPLFSGLYGGDLQYISQSVLKVPKSASSGMPPYIGFKNGIQSLVLKIAERLKFTTFCMQEVVLSISKSTNGLQIKTSKDSLEFDACLLTAPAHISAKILANSLPQAVDILSSFKASDACIVSLGFSSFEDTENLLDLAGSGVIIPEEESSIIRGITLSSKKWENRSPDNRLLIRVFGREGVFEKLEQSAAIELAFKEAQRILKFHGNLDYSELHKWQQGSALCGVGHFEKVSKLKAVLDTLPGVFVAGAPYGGIGIGDCLQSARESAQSILNFLNFKE